MTGESACASPENFDAELVRKRARENAINKLRPMMAYALKQRLHDEAELPAGLPLVRDPANPCRLIAGDPDKFGVMTIDGIHQGLK